MCYFPFSRTIRYIKCSFNLPDIIDRFIQGKNTGLYHEPGLPNLYGTFGITTRYNLSDMNSKTTGVFTFTNMGFPANYASNNDVGGYVTFDASIYNSIYGNSNTVQPKSIELSFYIKF